MDARIEGWFGKMKPSDWTEEQEQSLREFLARDDRPDGSLQFHELRGFLFGLVFAPRAVQVSEWVPEVFGGVSPDFLSKDEGQSVLKLLMRMWNNLAEFSNKDITDLPDLLGADIQDPETWSGWSDGFLRGWETVSEDWNKSLAKMTDEVIKPFDTSLLMLQFFSSVVQAEARAAETPEAFEKYANICRERFLEAANVYKDVGTHIFQGKIDKGEIRHGVRPGGESEDGTNVPIRVEKAPGRNAPCPCGSGKKFKKCCLH